MTNIIIPKGRTKNEIYKEAKELKRQISSHILSKGQMKDATEENINKEVKFQENFGKKCSRYQDLMKQLDGDPRARNIEHLRRR